MTVALIVNTCKGCDENAEKIGKISLFFLWKDVRIALAESSVITKKNSETSSIRSAVLTKIAIVATCSRKQTALA